MNSEKRSRYLRVIMVKNVNFIFELGNLCDEENIECF